MAFPVNVNGSTYSVPAVGERAWGANVSNLLIALANSTLQKTGGVFTLTADVNFGVTAGLIAKHLTSVTANPAQVGVIRLAKTDVLSFRNNANSADLPLGIDGSDKLTFNGIAVSTAASTVTLTGTQTLTNKTLTSPIINTPTGLVKADVALGNVDNTSDENKPVSTATATALATKRDTTSTVPVANGGTGQTTANAATNALLPSQTSNAGKYLGTNGTDTSWSVVSGGLSATAVSANVSPAVNNTMYNCTSTGGFTITLPVVPSLGGVIGVMDAGKTCSATNFIRVVPATGQSIDNLAANDSYDFDYPYAQGVFYAAAGATSWKLQKQATTMVQGGLVPGQFNGTAIGAGFLGEMTTSTWSGVTIATTTTSLANLPVTVGIYICTVNGYGNKGTSTGIQGALGFTSGDGSFIGNSLLLYNNTTDSGAAINFSFLLRVTTAGSIAFTATSTTASATSHQGAFSSARIG